MNGEGNVFTCQGNVINNWFGADRKKKSLDISVSYTHLTLPTT